MIVVLKRWIRDRSRERLLVNSPRKALSFFQAVVMRISCLCAVCLVIRQFQQLGPQVLRSIMFLFFSMALCLGASIWLHQHVKYTSLPYRLLLFVAAPKPGSHQAWPAMYTARACYATRDCCLDVGVPKQVRRMAPDAKSLMAHAGTPACFLYKLDACDWPPNTFTLVTVWQFVC